MQDQVPRTVEVPLPEPRRAEHRTSADVLRGLGLDALVDFLESTAYGVCVTGPEHTWVYLNPAGARLIGRPFEQLQGEDYLLAFAEHERGPLLALEGDQRQGDTGYYTNTIVQPDGTEVEMTWSGVAVTVDGEELAPAIFHETAGLRRAVQQAGSLLASSARLGRAAPGRELLQQLAKEAVTGTRAVGCLVLLASDPELPLEIVAGAGAGATSLRVRDLPGGELLAAGRVVPLADGRARLAARDETAGLAAVGDVDWKGSVKVPLRHGEDVVGCLKVLLPPTVTAPNETELAFWEALGAHASVALENERLRERAAAQAAELERQRLGRDLHDSVSQALFVLETRAKAITRALQRDDRAVVDRAAQDIEQVAHQAIADMRAMLGHLRPSDAPDDLQGRLASLVRATREREGLDVTLRVDPGLPTLAPAPAEHLYRIVAEALHNCVKHAAAREVAVRVTVDDDTVVAEVRDDGRGFHADGSPRGHGTSTMAERAALCGGRLTIESAAGAGTTVRAHLPRLPR